MRALTITDAERGLCLGNNVVLTSRPWSRLRRLLGRDHLEDGEGRLLSPCRIVHMWGSTMPVDVVFLDPAGCVIAVHPELQPGQCTRYYSLAQYALELPAGTIDRTGLERGDCLTWR